MICKLLDGVQPHIAVTVDTRSKANLLINLCISNRQRNVLLSEEHTAQHTIAVTHQLHRAGRTHHPLLDVLFSSGQGIKLPHCVYRLPPVNLIMDA